MNILFLNGSPKGKNSVTIKTAQYLEKRYPNGIYDFPQKKKGMLWGMKLLGLMMNSPKVRKKMKVQMTKFICAPYEKVIDETKAKEL